MVRHPAQAAALATALALAGGYASACGGAPRSPVAPRSSTTARAAPGRPDLGEMRLADCAGWRRGDERARRGTIREIAGFAGGDVGSPAGHGARLPDDVAYRFLDRSCAHGYATYFKLYKLYTRAAAFTPQR